MKEKSKHWRSRSRNLFPRSYREFVVDGKVYATVECNHQYEWFVTINDRVLQQRTGKFLSTKFFRTQDDAIIGAQRALNEMANKMFDAVREETHILLRNS